MPAHDGSDPAERPDNESARALLAAAGAVAAIWLAAAATWIIGDTVVPWDSKNQFYAFFRFLADALHSGASPFWNPYHYGGHPSIADPQSLIFAPLFFLWALFDPAPSIRAFDLLVYLHLLIGGLAMAVIGWRARWPLPATVFAAALFMLAGAASGRLQHTGVILSYGLFPLAWLMLQLALQKRSLLLALGFAAVAVVLALGRNQVALLLCYLLIAAAIAEIVAAEMPLRYLRERLPVLAVMLLAGASLLAVPLLLTLQFAALSNRPGELLDEALKGSLYPANLATLAVANIFGTHASYWGPNGAALPEVGHTDDSFNYLFVGWLPLILVLWIGVAGAGAWRRGRRLLAAALAVALLFMLGRYTPLFGGAFAWLPGIDLFRRPADASFLFSAALALLCGHLVTDYIRGGLPKRRGLAEALVASAIFAVLAAAVAFSARSGHGQESLFEIAKVILIPLLLIAALLATTTAAARTWVATGLVAVAVAELMWWNTAFRLNAEPRASYAVLEQPSGADAQAVAVLDLELQRDRARGERPRVEIVGLGGAWQNLAMVRGWPAINGYNPLRIGDYDRLVSPGEGNWRADMRKFPVSFRSYDCALARALGLKYLVLGRPIGEMPHPHGAVVTDTLLDGPRIWIYRLNNPMPRLKFVNRVQIADANPAIARQAQHDYAPDRVLLENSATRFRVLGPRLARDNAGRVKITGWRPGRIELETESEAGGVLAMHATAYPGWIAEIDGQQAPVLRADHLFRAVEVPAGRRRIVFSFRPLSAANLKLAAEMAWR